MEEAARSQRDRLLDTLHTLARAQPVTRVGARPKGTKACLPSPKKQKPKLKNCNTKRCSWPSEKPGILENGATISGYYGVSLGLRKGRRGGLYIFSEFLPVGSSLKKCQNAGNEFRVLADLQFGLVRAELDSVKDARARALAPEEPGYA